MSNQHNAHQIEDTNVISYSPLMSPYYLKTQMPLTEDAKETVEQSRNAIRAILRGEDDRKMLIVGPCSINDINAAEEYANMLNSLAESVKDVFVIVMRTYFEKPRTTVGWKGMIYEPYLNGEERINEGLSLARQMLVYNANMGLPSGTEFLDTTIPQYIGDLISAGFIGARTSEAQVYRELAAASSMSIGFKNNTAGNVEPAINAVISSKQGHWFIGLDQYGIPSVVKTRGNPDTYIVLRGGDSGTNYDSVSVGKAQALLRKKELSDRLMIDCSHGNSNKDHTRQPGIFDDVIGQIAEGNKGIIGLMLESNISEGKQDIPANPEELKGLKYGVSVTDACIGWETTESLIREAHDLLAAHRD